MIHVRKKSHLLLLSFIIFLSLLNFILIAHEVVIENEDRIDNEVFGFLKSHTSRDFIDIFHFITFFGSSYFIFPGWIIVLTLLLIRRQKHKALLVGIVAIAGSFLLFGLKRAFGRQRPDMPLFAPLTNFSFPSGHAFSSLLLALVAIWLILTSEMNRVLKIIISISLLVFSFLIGVSRVVLRYHYASDVIGGFSLAIAFLGLIMLALTLYNKKVTRRSKTDYLNV